MRSLLVLFVAVAFFATGEALKCYQCRWPQDGCNDDFKKSADKEVTCNPPMDACMKVTAEMSNGTIAQGRSCSYKISVTKTLSNASEVFIVKESAYYCTSDLCNGVSATSAALSALTVIAVPFIYANYQ